jgi:hypothetical protein
MSDVAQNLIALLKADTTVTKWSSRFHEDHVPQHVYKGKDTEAFVWLGVRQTTDHGTLDDSTGALPDELVFDIECVAGKAYDAKQLAIAVRAKLNNYRGTMSDQTTKGIFVRDQDNDYIPKATGGDNGLFVAAYDVQVWV